MSEDFGQVWVLKAFEEKDGRRGPSIEGVFDELRHGRARIGWSYDDDLDLRIIRDKGGDLNEAQEAATKCLPFLTKMEKGDVILYPHQPEEGKFSIVRVTGEYDYDDGLENGDFRSVRPCELVSGSPVDMYDEIVTASLRERMGLPGRLSRVSDTGPLAYLLDNLPKAGKILGR